MPTRSLAGLMRRLGKAGFEKSFVSRAILPDWWDESCAVDEKLLPDIEVRVARFLKTSVAVVRDPGGALRAPTYEGATLRRVRGMSRERLAPAIYAALEVAGAVARCLREPPVPIPPPGDPLEWRQELQRTQPILRLSTIVGNLWSRGVPVVALGVLPSPAFQGLACLVGRRPVVMLGHLHDDPGRLAFLVAHEVGHLTSGDCSPGRPVVDDQEEVADASDMEKRADWYAARVLTGDLDRPAVAARSYRELASRAVQLESAHQVDAAAVIWGWARDSGDYATATRALQALYLAKGGQRCLRQHFERNVDREAASETDRALLRCVAGEPTDDATSR